MRCTHGNKYPNCKCFEERTIATMKQARAVLASRRATWEEWHRCSLMFIEKGEYGDAAECAVLAVSQIKTPRARELKLIPTLSLYFRARSYHLRMIPRPGIWFSRFLQSLRGDLGAEHEIRSNAEAELSRLKLLISDNTKYSRTKLASILREPRPGDALSNQIRWGRPELALDILNASLAHEPTDVYALTTRAAVHLDLGNLTDALADGTEALRLTSGKPQEQVAPAAVVARASLADNNPGYALEVLLAHTPSEPETPFVAMLYRISGEVSESMFPIANFSTKAQFRGWIEGLVAKQIQVDARKAELVYEVAALRLLCGDAKYSQAMQLLAELHREGWWGNTEYWEKQIRSYCRRDPGCNGLPTLEDLIRSPKDFYPDHTTTSKSEKRKEV